MTHPLWWHVPRSVRAHFYALGAVKVGCPMATVRRHSRGGYTADPVTEIVYFFDAAGHEIGYWTSLDRFFGETPVVFAPNYREWHPSFLAQLVWCDLPPTLLPLTSAC